MNKKRNTIFALATPPGKSALAVIRMSGPLAFETIQNISSVKKFINLRATLNKIINKKGEVVDKTITTTYKAPKTYTGENMVEISLHGGSATIKKTIELINKQKNTRMAEPGEFTRRAFENNKLDLTQVEAISDLVRAETEAQRKQAIGQLSGNFSNKIHSWTSKIFKSLSNIEAAIDFADENLPDNIILKSKEQIKNIYLEIEDQINDSKYGEKIRSGFVVSILGKTNVGKSSFLNHVAKRDIAIVTNEPGTTRDLIELFVDFKGYPIKLYDTAGIRKSKNIVEKKGIEKSLKIAKISDINLIFIKNEKDIKNFIHFNNSFFIQSKVDINKKITSKNKIYHISSKTGFGIDILLDDIYKKISKIGLINDFNVSRERHREILNNTVSILKNSIKPKNMDKFAEDVRLSVIEISKITGKKDVEELLDLIFSDFCIGK